MGTKTRSTRDQFLAEIAGALLTRRVGFLAPSANDETMQACVDDARAVLSQLAEAGLVDRGLVAPYEDRYRLTHWTAPEHEWVVLDQHNPTSPPVERAPCHNVDGDLDCDRAEQALHEKLSQVQSSR